MKVPNWIHKIICFVFWHEYERTNLHIGLTYVRTTYECKCCKHRKEKITNRLILPIK